MAFKEKVYICMRISPILRLGTVVIIISFQQNDRLRFCFNLIEYHPVNKVKLSLNRSQPFITCDLMHDNDPIDIQNSILLIFCFRNFLSNLPSLTIGICVTILLYKITDNGSQP